MKLTITVFLALGLLSACGQQQNQPAEPAKTQEQAAAPAQTESSSNEEETIASLFPAEMVKCPDVRPELCTMEYDPALGFKANGESEEYGNKCSACSDPEVVGYVKTGGGMQ